ncbi:serine hydrolase [Phenylobacterium sp.]|uniref:serine hydrolase domain-containing protein n=1 Tax=Phenylobacterium sp. TaxID=1871053 RepID=UPI0025CC537F|nr:serine hydrolase [Phenylobacterium sp.]MCA3746601.1 serine hydrolase [Phenylobacterium sp.]
MGLMTAGLTATLLLPARARAAGPDFGPCAGFIASAPARRRTWIRGEAPAGRPFRLDSPFRVASVSKMIAAAVIVPIAAALPGGLDADVSDRLGFRLRHPAWPETPIRLRHLLSHLSGLRNGPSYPVPAGRPLSSAFTPGGVQYDGGGWFGPAAFPPGARFSYADVNFAVLAQWAEQVTGQRFDQLMRERLLAPAGTEAGYNWSGVSQAARLRAAPGLRREGDAWVAQVDAEPPREPRASLLAAPETPGLTDSDVRPGENGFVFSPQGGLRLSLQDMDRLARRFLSDTGAYAEMEATAWRLGPEGADNEGGVMLAYGLGVQVLTGLPGPAGDAFFGPDSADWRGHLGDAYGWMTGLFWNRRTGESLLWALNGMPETDRPPGRRTALTAPEEDLIAAGLRALGRKTGPG